MQTTKADCLTNNIRALRFARAKPVGTTECRPTYCWTGIVPSSVGSGIWCGR